MKITKGLQVELEYQLFITDVNGEMVEETEDGAPFSFTFGVDQLLPKFEAAIEGLGAGESFSVTIACADAYGPENDELYVEFPKETFVTEEGVDEDAIAIGEIVPMADDAGNEIFGVVVENKLNSVVLDFNHPLAGEDIHFEGTVVKVAALN